MSNHIKFTIPGKKLQYNYIVESLPLAPQKKKELRLEIARRLPPNVIPLHACVISNGHKTILISGVSKSGKSTLARILKKLGFNTEANDFVATWLHGGDLYVSDINLEENNQDKTPLKIDQVIFLKPEDPRDVFKLSNKQLKILYQSTLTPLNHKDLRRFLINPVFEEIYKLHYCLGNRKTPQRWLQSIKNTLYEKKPSRIGIIGMGTIGQDLSNLLIREPWLTSLSLYSPNQNKLGGIILDLNSANPNLQINQAKSAKSVFKKSDIVVLCFNINSPATTIDSLSERHRKIIAHSEVCHEIASDIRKIKNFLGTILVVSNPVDFLSWYLYEKSDLLSNQIYGIGLGLDKKRLQTITNEKFEVIGEHGDEIKIAKVINNTLSLINSPKLLSLLTSYSNRIRQFTTRTRFGPVHEILSIITSFRKRNAAIRVSTKYDDSFFLGDIIELSNKIGVTKYLKDQTLEEQLLQTKSKFKEYCRLLDTNL